MSQSKFPRFEPYALSLLRIVAGFIYWMHGLQKIAGVYSSAGPVPAGTLLWYAGLIEFVFGALLIWGLFTSSAAFLCSGEMTFAYFIAHFPSGVLPIKNGGDTPVLLSFIFLYLFAAGGGPLSLDNAITNLKMRRVAAGS